LEYRKSNITAYVAGKGVAGLICCSVRYSASKEIPLDPALNISSITQGDQWD